MLRHVPGILLGLVAATVAGTAAAQEDLNCPYRGSNPAARRSPLDSVAFTVNGRDVKVCYGRPSSRGRTMIGGTHVPYGRVWRTGANETTKIRTTTALSVAGIDIAPGTYAIYTVPGESSWEVLLTRAWQQWGRENYFTEQVRAQLVGRATVARERVEDHIETFTIRAEPGDAGVSLILEWEHTRIRVPITGR